MPDQPFIPGWAAKLSLKRAAGTQMDIPMLQGSQYGISDNPRVEMLSQGSAANAFPVNYNPGIKVAALSVLTRAFAGWFTVTNLNELLMTRDATYGTLFLFGARFNDGLTLTSDDVKASA